MVGGLRSRSFVPSRCRRSINGKGDYAMADYEDTPRDIQSMLGLVPGFMKALPKDVLVNDWALFKKYTLEESKIPTKYRELIGLAVATNIKCPYYQYFHTGAAKLRGATDEELAELDFLASYTARWSAMIHAQDYDYDTFTKETDQIGAHLTKMMPK
jgi:AhpD family alkylhydroperoxidase